jgi:hypothetical protein
VEDEVLEWILCDRDGDEVDSPCPKPVLSVGDWMWVKEAYQEFCPLWDGVWCGHGTEQGKASDHYMVYRADNPDGAFVWKGGVIYCNEWKLVDMPRRCARFFRQITGIKAERIADISEEDAVAEGFGLSMGFTTGGAMGLASARYMFSREWIRIHKGESWDRNDWVWAYTFAPGPPRPLPARTEYAGW